MVAISLRSTLATRSAALGEVLLHKVYRIYRCRVNLVEQRQVEAAIIAQQHQAHRLRQNTLEDVFIHLTGRRLRE